MKLKTDRGKKYDQTEPLNGDCVDFSGSRVKLQDLEINGAGDKGISVGEASEVWR